MVSAKWSRRTRYGDRHIVLEIEIEGAEYLAEVLRQHESHDAGAVAIASEIEAMLARTRWDDEELAAGGLPRPIL